MRLHVRRDSSAGCLCLRVSDPRVPYSLVHAATGLDLRPISRAQKKREDPRVPRFTVNRITRYGSLQDRALPTPSCKKALRYIVRPISKNEWAKGSHDTSP